MEQIERGEKKNSCQYRMIAGERYDRLGLGQEERGKQFCLSAVLLVGGAEDQAKFCQPEG
jgi:hypothetical protein